MNFWERITGSDLTREWRAFEARAEALPDDYRLAWEQIKANLMPHGDFTGRNLTPIIDTMRSLLTDGTPGPDIGVAVAWALGILVVFYVASLRIYRRSTSVPVPQ